MKPTQETIIAWLEQVKDPEIPVLSICDMGIVTAIETGVTPIKIHITPTFVGCPALESIKSEIISALKEHSLTCEVIVSYKTPWTSDLISPKGKAALKEFGIGPPPLGTMISDLSILENTECPRCGSHNTELRSPFGSTLCRSIHYCQDCHETFEQFKPV